MAVDNFGVLAAASWPVGQPALRWIVRVALVATAGFGSFGVLRWVRSAGEWRRSGQPLPRWQHLVPVAYFSLLTVTSLLALWLMPPEHGLGLFLMIPGLSTLVLPIRPRAGETIDARGRPAQQPFVVAAEVATGVGLTLMGLMFFLSPP